MGGFYAGTAKLRLDGRRIALVGLGNSVLYPNNFVDGLSNFADLIEEKGGILIGKTETDGYTYTLSRSIQDNLFMGLPLDEDNEANQTDARIEKWLSLVLPEMES